VYVATQTLDSNGDMYDPKGYVLVNGTSFSAPLVAGMAALIKSARPGLTVDQYRSLLINTAATVDRTWDGNRTVMQQTGAGLVDASAALNAPVTATPVSLAFGAGGGDIQSFRTVRLTNTGKSLDQFTISVTARSGASTPWAPDWPLELAPGSSVDVPIAWTASGLAAGTYEGFLTVQATSSGTAIRVPYWYAVTAGEPAGITSLRSMASARRGSTQRNAILVRVTDVSGVALLNVPPEVTAISGDGAASGVRSYDHEVPGVFGIDVQLGPLAGTNVFRIQAGNAFIDVAIAGY